MQSFTGKVLMDKIFRRKKIITTKLPKNLLPGYYVF